MPTAEIVLALTVPSSLFRVLGRFSLRFLRGTAKEFRRIANLLLFAQLPVECRKIHLQRLGRLLLVTAVIAKNLLDILLFFRF